MKKTKLAALLIFCLTLALAACNMDATATLTSTVPDVAANADPGPSSLDLSDPESLDDSLNFAGLRLL